MKNLLKFFILFFIIYLVGCDDKVDSLEHLNKTPKIDFFGRNSLNWSFIDNRIIDSAKVYNENNNSNYSCSLRIKDQNQNYESVTINEIENGGLFFINDDFFQGEKLVKIDSFSVAYRYYAPETRLFSLSATDDFGNTKQVEFEIRFIENLLPIASLEIRSSIVDNIKEYILDASVSEDSDRSIGGFISNYEYTIDGQVIVSPNSIIYHVFNSGTHTVSVRVQDNDGAWSQIVNKTINVD